MQRLNSFYSISTEQLLSDLSFALEDTTFEELKQLAGFGFEITIIAGTVFLKYDVEAIANLVVEEIDYLEDREQIEDFMELKDVKFFTNWKVDWLTPYIKADRTLQNVIEDIQMDWKLEPDEYKQLSKKRNMED